MIKPPLFLHLNHLPLNFPEAAVESVFDSVIGPILEAICTYVKNILPVRPT